MLILGLHIDQGRDVHLFIQYEYAIRGIGYVMQLTIDE